MEELIAALLSGLIQVLVEALGELLCQLLVNGFYRALVRALGKQKMDAVAMGAFLLFTGALCGAASVWLLPHPVVHRSPLHGISVILSPLCVGGATWQIGKLFDTPDEPSTGAEDFWSGALFAFSMALVRLVMVH